MRLFKGITLALLCLLFTGRAFAQDVADVKIVAPAEGAPVRGEVTIQYEGLPAGGYAIVKLDGNFVQATALPAFQLDTLSDRTLFPNGDGKYQLDITVMNASGGQVGTASTTLNVSNNVTDMTGDPVRLVVFTPAEFLSDTVDRYRVFAVSDANISGGSDSSGGGGGGGGGSGTGGSDTGIEWIDAPLDWQLAALMRRVVRDTDLIDGAANLRTIVQDSYERQREIPSDLAMKKQSKHAKKTGTVIRMKPPWALAWTEAAETGQYFVKLVQPDGTEINPTRKAATIAIADLLPTFPDTDVRPGSTWETTMTILGELSSRTPISVKAPITFTAYENLVTPGGQTLRCAKLESRFRLPEDLAKTIAAGLENYAGRSSGQATSENAGANAPAAAPPSTAAAGAASTSDDAVTPDDIDTARTDVSRVLWFDVVNQKVLRSEDNIKTFYEILPDTSDAAPAAGGAPAAAGQPKDVNYSLKVTTWLDDRIPVPTGRFNGGAGTAHAHENVQDPTLVKAIGGAVSE